MSEINWNKLASLEYWLEGIAGGAGSSYTIRPVDMSSSFFWVYLYSFSVLFLLGIMIRVSQAFIHEENPFQAKFPSLGNNFISMGILGYFWFFLRQTQITFLGTRIWLIFGVIWFLILGYWFVSYLFTFYGIEMNYFKKEILGKKETSKS